jgi:hypothetical protein
MPIYEAMGVTIGCTASLDARSPAWCNTGCSFQASPETARGYGSRERGERLSSSALAINPRRFPRCPG